jgi:hypothetical protein
MDIDHSLIIHVILSNCPWAYSSDNCYSLNYAINNSLPLVLCTLSVRLLILMFQTQVIAETDDSSKDRCTSDTIGLGSSSANPFKQLEGEGPILIMSFCFKIRVHHRLSSWRPLRSYYIVRIGEEGSNTGDVSHYMSNVSSVGSSHPPYRGVLPIQL